MVTKQLIKDYSVVELTGALELYQEIRYERDGDDFPIYIGYNRQPNAATTAETWFIVKNTFTDGAITRQQLPDDGVQYKYSWDDRATYFS